MIRLQYTTPTERETILTEQTALGLQLIEEQNLFEGSFLIFEEPAVLEVNDMTDELIRKIGKAMFNHENRIRALEGKAPITVAQFKTAIINL